MAATAPTVTINAEFPRKLDFLLGTAARYKVLHGGRGGTKSWGIARALIIRALTEPGGLRVLCAREVQSSMKDSVHQLLKDQIDLMGLGAKGTGHFRVLDDQIRGPNGGLFTFKGLKDPDALKSTEGVAVAWLEEANRVTKTSWNKLDPTIRKPGSEIWVSMNPELETDHLYDLFIKKEPPPRSIVVKVTWRDNAWLSEELRQQMETMKATDYDNYLHVWEGHCIQALDGAVYAEELRALTRDGRITRLPYIPGRPVQTFWDLGHSDHTAIWFAQPVGFQYHVIDYYENNRKLMDHYLQVLQNRGYLYGTMWLPHDAASIHPGVERTVERQMKDAGHKVKIVPKVSLKDGIEAARTIFPLCLFDASRCEDGLNRLRYYRYGVNEKDGRWTRAPVHDQSSHASDALRYMGVALKGDPPEKPGAKKAPRNQGASDSLGWMGR